MFDKDFTSQASDPVEIFFSYAHEDEELRNDLSKHLKLLERKGIISAWYDRDISAGDNWNETIEKHLNSAKIILLLVSADFLASDFCWSIELKRAMERHEAKEACVIPIILRPVDWKDAPFGKLQALPKDAIPVTSWANSDEAFVNIVKGIRASIKNLIENQEYSFKPSSKDELTNLQVISSSVRSKGHSAMLIYRAKFRERFYEDYGDNNRRIHPISRKALNRLQKELNLTQKDVEKIETEIIHKCESYQDKVLEYKQAVEEILLIEGTLTEKARRKLRGYQDIMKIGDESVALALTLLGQKLSAQGKQEKSDLLLREAISMDQNNAAAYSALAISFWKERKIEEALHLLITARDLYHNQKLFEEEQKINTFILSIKSPKQGVWSSLKNWIHKNNI